jgi:hypothetical protein
LASREPADDLSVAGCFGWIFLSAILAPSSCRAC